jgi:hypothetical protein
MIGDRVVEEAEDRGGRFPETLDKSDGAPASERNVRSGPERMQLQYSALLELLCGDANKETARVVGCLDLVSRKARGVLRGVFVGRLVVNDHVKTQKNEPSARTPWPYIPRLSSQSHGGL